METIGNYITDDNGHLHKLKAYDARHEVYIIIEEIDQDQTRAVMGYDARKKNFVLISDNVELGTVQRIEEFEPWDPLIYQDWKCMS
ncbi:hypothetical protein Q0590_08670 [Rhodocytophaga aerolata]|uniref:Uncharacterized protein n=1 Tax=Rhodocytophaga aerolata TaxID=455078 RepID=A0ABT8R3S1_9BACT|nr:hypothetical protein [Rhodocytophaga aerolata]MDO1446321.1 hypothetical protein [Rhodocytophaga aerolata]